MFDYVPLTTGNEAELFTRVHLCVQSVVSREHPIFAHEYRYHASMQTPVSKIHVNDIECFVASEANPYFAEVFIERRQG